MLEGLLADDMLHPAGIPFRRFWVYAGLDQPVGKEAVLFVDLLRHFPAHIGQANEAALIPFNKTTPACSVVMAWVMLGLVNPMCRAISTGRTMPIFLENKDSLQVIFSRRMKHFTKTHWLYLLLFHVRKMPVRV